MILTYAKWGGIAAFLIGLSFFWYHQGGLASKTKLEALQAANALSLADAYKAQEAAHIAKETALAIENAHLKDNALQFPTMAVRVCHFSAPVPIPRKSGQVIPPSPGVGAGNPVEVPQQSGPDYGPSLFGLADALDQITAKCRAL